MEENAIQGEAVEQQTAQESAAAGQEDISAGELDEEFDRLIKGRFRDAYKKRAQTMINRRFKEMKELEAYREEKERERGDEYRRRSASDALGVAGEYSKLIREAEETRAAYPSFELEKECHDPKFISLLKSGIGVRGAYEALHHADIVKGAMQYAADRVYEAAQKGTALAAERPEENGVSDGGAIDPAKNVASLTERDIRDIIRRVEKGETIKF